MNGFDGATAAVMAYGAWRGMRRGVAQEAYRMVRMLVALAAGCGLYGLVARGIGQLAGGTSGAGGFLVAFGGAYALVRAAKRRFLAWVEARTSSWARWSGGAAGAVRGLAAMLAAGAVLNVSPFAALKDGVLGGSAVGRVASWFTPGAAGETQTASPDTPAEEAGP